MKVLYLTPWYPNASDAMAGLFVQKHVESVRAQGVDVRVIHSQGWRDLWQQWRQLKRTWGLPDLVQLNVIQKQGLLALYLLARCRIPYIIIEHWSGYLPENGLFMQQSAIKKRLARLIARRAQAILTVSRTLENAMKQCGIHAAQWGHINNVVDDFFYKEQCVTLREAKMLLHISCYDERAKNTTALLRGFSALCERRKDIQLVMLGTGKDYATARQTAAELAIPANLITWTGEQTPEQVCEWLHQASAFVLTSRYETAGIVLCEAVATGTPIIATPVGLAPELVNEKTGLLISQEQANTPQTLANAMEQVVNMSKYTVQGHEFSQKAVGKYLKDLYDSCLHHNI